MVHGYCIFGGWMVATAMDIIFAADAANQILELSRGQIRDHQQS